MDVAKHPEFWLQMATNLRATDIFADALRHVVGRAKDNRRSIPFNHPGSDYLEIPREAVQLVLLKTAHLDQQMRELTRELRVLGLFDDQKLKSVARHKTYPEPVRTTWLASGYAGKDPHRICEWIAKSVYREFLDQQLYGGYECKEVPVLSYGPSLCQDEERILVADASEVEIDGCLEKKREGNLVCKDNSRSNCRSLVAAVFARPICGKASSKSRL